MYKDQYAGGEDVEEEHDDITEEELLSKVLVNDDLWRFFLRRCLVFVPWFPPLVPPRLPPLQGFNT